MADRTEEPTEETPPKTREERVAEVVADIEAAREDLAIANAREVVTEAEVNVDRQTRKANRAALLAARRDAKRKRDELVEKVLAGAEADLAPDPLPEEPEA